ncbi:substrate-binding domain-containing protein [Actinoplanes regularis]|uniref:substrate-binding domain-containing protein n=1 Tax=Actinoplanes regularis TaxID=52697 RepID=UPI0024A5449A|nr:substrate-binding domain-containing protein [Actinoplanes regularis]GLW34724.1 sugar ABC transporter [Actinoplanes regularis]
MILPGGRRGTLLLALATATCLMSTACGADEGAGGDDNVAVALITKNSTNPFFVTMQDGARKAAEAEGVKLTVAAGKEDGDEAGQVQAIEDAIARGDEGILITPNGPGVNPAIKKARDAGLYVIALDTPPDPANTVDITFATDNFKAGELIGQWTAKQLAGKPASIALLDLFADKIVSVDYNRDQGFLKGMGIDTKDPKVNGDEAKTGSYAAGTYSIVCNEPTNGAEDGGRTAMERCLAKNPAINVVYTINEPAAVGARKAIQAAGTKDILVVSIDGGCAGVQQVKDGLINATSQQYPVKMAELGVQAIKKIARGGEKPQTTGGLDFFDTGVSLVTDQPASGVDSIDTAEGASKCWGKA